VPTDDKDKRLPAVSKEANIMFKGTVLLRKGKSFFLQIYRKTTVLNTRTPNGDFVHGTDAQNYES